MRVNPLHAPITGVQAIVTGVRTILGRPVVDVTVPGTPFAFQSVPLAVLGGGAYGHIYAGPDVTETGLPPYDPTQTEASQVVLMFRGSGMSNPIGAVYHAHPQMGMVDTPPEVSDTEDHPGTVSTRDTVVARKSIKFILDHSGRATLDARQATDHVRIQLPSGKRLRVSRGGSATEKLLLSGPTRDHMDAVVAALNELRVRVAELERCMQLMAPLFDASAGVPVLGAVVLFQMQTDSGDAEPTTDLITSGAFAVPADSEGS